MKFLTLTLALASLALAAAAQAQTSTDPAATQPMMGGRDHAGMSALRQACAADVVRLCPDAAAGQARMQCMREHRDDLSDSCKSAIAAARAARQQGGAPGQAQPDQH